jgi:uncharacterized membrane protein YhaH (DUF805 family)
MPSQERLERRLILLWFGIGVVLIVVGLLERHTRFARLVGALLLLSVFAPIVLIRFQRWRGRR